MSQTAMMRTILLTFVAACLAGCAGQDEKDEPREDPVTRAVEDFIDVRQLEETDRIVTGSSDGWTQLNEHYILYSGRRDTYLVEFTRRCHELNDNTRITPDRRWDNNYIRPKFDTIRGCRIARAFELSETELTELENIGEAPGSRN